MEELAEHFATVRESQRAMVRAAVANPESAYTVDDMYNERFNLRAVDMPLVRDRIEHQREERQTASDAWDMYVRFLLEPGLMFAYTALNQDLFLYVAENKSLPNREAPAHDGVATGRHLTVAWFNPKAEHTDPLHVVPVAGETGKLQLMNSTMAEIIRAAGFHPDVLPHHTERDVESMYMSYALTHELAVYECRRVSYDLGGVWGDASWTFELTQPPNPIEEYMFRKRDLRSLTKMALARRIQLRDVLSDEQREVLWRQSKEALVQYLLDDPHAVAGPPGGVAPVALGPLGAPGGGDGHGHYAVGGGVDGGGRGAAVDGAGRGRGRGRRGRGRGRGRG